MKSIERVAILSPGEMGSAIGLLLHKAGLDVMTCLDGRSNRTRVQAFDARIREVATYELLLEEAELVLSVVPPAAALAVAERVAAGLRATRERITYVDCNPVAPADTRRMADLIQSAGSAFIDAAIVGSPPYGLDSTTRFYCAGPDTSALEALRPAGLDVRVLGSQIGEASGLEVALEAS